MATAEPDHLALHPTDIAARRFPITRKGYAAEDVDGFLRRVAEQVERLQGEIEWLRARAEHLERRSNAAQEAAYARLSRDFVDVVRRAEEVAARVRADAQSRAKDTIEEANHQAGRILAIAAQQADEIVATARRETSSSAATGWPLRDPFTVESPRTSVARDGDEPEDLSVELDASLFDLLEGFD